MTVTRALNALLLTNIASIDASSEANITHPLCALSATQIQDAGFSTTLAKNVEEIATTNNLCGPMAQ